MPGMHAQNVETYITFVIGKWESMSNQNLVTHKLLEIICHVTFGCEKASLFILEKFFDEPPSTT